MTTLVTPAAVADPAPWGCLFEPATAVLGETILARSLLRACRAWRPWVARVIAAQVAVPVELGDLVAPAVAEWCWGAEFGLPDGGTVRVWVDADAARALVDALVVRRGGYVAPGPLTGVEQGLLDFLLVHTLLECAKAAPATGIRMNSTLSPARAADRVDAASFSVRLSVGARRGWLRLDLPRTTLAAAAPPSVAVTSDPSALGLSVVFGSTIMPLAEFAAATPGDLLLLSPGAYPVSGVRCKILAATGWCVAEGEVLVDTPRSLRVRCSALRPDLLLDTAPAGMCSWRLAVGHAEVGPTMLQTWREGVELEFAKDASGPCCTWPGSRAARGELVRVDQEVALRILALREETLR